MGPIVRLIGSSIGLASEAIAARKSSKTQQHNTQQQSHPPPMSTNGNLTPNPSNQQDLSPDPPAYTTLDPTSSHYGLVEVANDQHAQELIERGHAIPFDRPPELRHEFVEGEEGEGDEVCWELDECAADLEDRPACAGREMQVDGDNAKEEKPDVHKLVKRFLEKHPSPAKEPPYHPLPCPVVIPQQRPHAKSRGFVRAYAPVLEACGIDEATFMDFLKTFRMASQASPVFEVIFLGGHLVGYVPSLATTITSIIVQAMAGTAIIVQSRHRTNTFLDEINNHFFRPRGLYAMLMSYKPSRHAWSSAPTDISHSIAHSAEPDDLSEKFSNNLKFSAGKSHTQMELPECAPLIFPALDAVANDSSPEATKKENTLKKSSRFVGDYMDRRAQAEFNAENHGSSLAIPQGKQFASRYSDPTHPANSGSLVSLVTGGRYDPRSRWGRGPVGRLRNATGTDKPLRKMIRANVVYLMIVNMPSEEEMREAKREMEREKKDGKKDGVKKDGDA